MKTPEDPDAPKYVVGNASDLHLLTEYTLTVLGTTVRAQFRSPSFDASFVVCHDRSLDETTSNLGKKGVARVVPHDAVLRLATIETDVRRLEAERTALLEQVAATGEPILVALARLEAVGG